MGDLCHPLSASAPLPAYFVPPAVLCCADLWPRVQWKDHAELECNRRGAEAGWQMRLH